MTTVEQDGCPVNGITEASIASDYPDLMKFWHLEPDEYREQYGEHVPQICLYGFQHGAGWNWLVEQVFEYIEAQDVETTVVQVKEKFGGLRIYTAGVQADGDRAADRVFNAIQFAGHLSRGICEMCGQTGATFHDEGWLQTRCDNCFDEESQ